MARMSNKDRRTAVQLENRKNHLGTALDIAAARAEYDEHVKNLLADKVILSHILAGVVTELNGMMPQEIVPLIEEPQVSSVATNPGETNLWTQSDMPMISGTNLESKIPGEGTITYDIHFHVMVPGEQERIKIIIDLEAQKNKPGYDLVTRGTFYNARQISAQLGREFEIPNYQDMKKVYSIWICMNSPKCLENTAVAYDVQPKILTGSLKSFGKYDLQTVVVLYLSKNLAENKEELSLHRFLGTLLLPAVSLKEKRMILETEYRVPFTERRMNVMCNLSEAIWEDGIEQGIEQERQELIFNMFQSGLSFEQIKVIVGDKMKEEQLREIEGMVN